MTLQSMTVGALLSLMQPQEGLLMVGPRCCCCCCCLTDDADEPVGVYNLKHDFVAAGK